MDKIKEFIINNKRQVIIIGAAIVSIIIIIIAMVIVSDSTEKEIETEPVTTQEETTTEAPTEPPTEDIYVGKERSLITGEYVDEKIAKRRPVAVMINNISDALPQSGIGNAGVIYEAPVEGGITRLMAIFDDYSGLDKIGSIRSCRIYYCYFALEWDAIYCHYGQSKYALDFLKSDNIDNIGSYNAGNCYYQTKDRYAPHNTYIDTDGIKQGIKNLEYRKNYKDGHTEKFKFADIDTEVSLSNGTAAKTVEINYPHNYPYFQYDKSSGLYLRYQLGKKHVDDQIDSQLAVKNIIIQKVDTTLYPDGKSIDMTVTGTGSGYYITNGKAIEINWSKKEKSKGITKYTDAKTGEEIVLNTGKTWVCVVQNSTDVTISE